MIKINRHEAMETFEKHKLEHRMIHKRANELLFLCKYMHIFKRVTFIVTLVIIFFMLNILGFKMATCIIAVMLVVNEITIIYMISRMENRFIKPMAKLQGAVKTIAKGDYSIRIENEYTNEVGILTEEFNKMASKLEEGERISKEYERNRKELIANISHDLKTPITSINGYIEGVLDGEIDVDKARKYLSVIKSNSEYMNRLIDDLFLFSKLDMQKVDFNFVNTNIKFYMSDISDEIGFMLYEKNIKFSYSDGIDEDILIALDGKRLYRAIRNIVDNSIKYGRDKEDLKIEISTFNDENNVFITISDNGYGIEKDKVDKIFERFYRVDRERRKDLNSTGLGLAIAKEMVESHNGKIYVSSEIDKGTTFTIKLRRGKM